MWRSLISLGHYDRFIDIYRNIDSKLYWVFETSEGGLLFSLYRNDAFSIGICFHDFQSHWKSYIVFGKNWFCVHFYVFCSRNSPCFPETFSALCVFHLCVSGQGYYGTCSANECLYNFETKSPTARFIASERNHRYSASAKTYRKTRRRSDCAGWSTRIMQPRFIMSFRRRESRLFSLRSRCHSCQRDTDSGAGNQAGNVRAGLQGAMITRVSIILDMPRNFCIRRDRYRKCIGTGTIQSCERERPGLFRRLLCQFFFAAGSKRVSRLHQRARTGTSSNNCWTVVAANSVHREKGYRKIRFRATMDRKRRICTGCSGPRALRY